MRNTHNVPSMTNFTSVLKSEIARVARREVRAEIESLKKASTQYRSAIAQLRREVAALHKELRQAHRPAAGAARASSGAPAPADGDAQARRFSATRLASHRAKLGLSAALYGQLVGMSGATIYLWEQGKGRPKPEQLQRLAAVRALSRSAALAQLGKEG